MKNTFYSGILTLVLICGFGLAGCGTPKQTAYKSLAAIGMTVDKASDALVAARIDNKVSNSDWEQAKIVQKKWLLAYNEACDLAAFDYTKAAPASLLQLEKEVLNTINLILQKP